MGFVQIQPQGIDDIRDRLGKMQPRLRNNILRGALRAAAVVIRNSARATSPDVTGNLRKSLRASSKILRGGHAIGEIKVGNNVAFYAHMVLGGTKPHVIVAKRARGLAFMGGFARRVMHPGAKGQPFLFKAGHDHLPQAAQAFSQYVFSRMKAGLVQGANVNTLGDTGPAGR